VQLGTFKALILPPKTNLGKLMKHKATASNNKNNSSAGTNVGIKDYINLCKPRVVMLMLITSYVGMILAVPSIHLLNASQVIAAGLGIAFAAGAGGAINQIIDRRLDKIMARTQKRPLPSGAVPTKHAVIQAIIMSALSLFILGWKVNIATMWLTAATLIGYGFLYSGYLKRASPQNIVIGGLAGAMPPMLGWTAGSGHLLGAGWALVLIIFAWTPPHFWALSIHRERDYAKAGLPMLPITHGIACTKLQIFIYTIFMAVSTYIPCSLMQTGWIYFIAASVLNIIFIYYSWQLLTNKNPRYAWATFKYSITYLGLLFMALVIDHLVF
jgi:heme o synthase